MHYPASESTIICCIYHDRRYFSDSQPKLVGWVRRLALTWLCFLLLSQWLCLDESTINIGLAIIVNNSNCIVITHASCMAAGVSRAFIRVCLSVCALKGKRLELSTPNLVHVYTYTL